MKLISMTDFVLQENFKTHSRFFPETVIKYAEFLKQPLTLGMFVPVDEEGNVLEEPRMIERTIGFDEKDVFWDVDEVETYRKAKEKVLFEGFSSTYNGFSIVSVDRIDVEDNYRLSFNKEGGCRQYYNLEELVMSDENFEIELTPSALKQIGL